MLRIRLLGPLHASVDDTLLERPARRHTERLWVYLLLQRAVPLPRDQVAFALWPDATEDKARAELRRHLSYLVRYLPKADNGEPWIAREGRRTVRWNEGAEVWLDVEEFETLTRRHRVLSHETDLERAAADLERAVALYLGPLADGLDDAWLLPTRERLATAFASSLERLSTVYVDWGDLGGSADAAERLVAHDPLHEGAHRCLMRLHYLGGDRARALEQYEACRASLMERLRVEPAPETRALREAIEQGDLLAGEPAPGHPTSVDIVPAARSRIGTHNLPSRLSRFVGRRDEIEQAGYLLKASRLLTLMGIGGAGKTRLALELAGRQVDRCADGVWWVELANVTDEQRLVDAVAAALGVSPEGSRPLIDSLERFLARRKALLVMDNCEHLVAGVAQLADTLLRGCPGLDVLATSRERLEVEGEVTWIVPPLSLPDCERAEATDDLLGADSVQLFLDRVHASWPSFEATRDRLMAIARICCQVEGIPLAIELAASRVSVLPVDQIAERLEGDFGLLRSPSRTRPARQKTLAAAVEWSHQLLAPAEQALLRRLSVFAGGFSLAAAEAVCAIDLGHGGGSVSRDEVLDLVAGLIDKSLVSVDVTVVGGHRYRMLEVIRRYGRTRLEEAGEEPAIMRSYVAHFVGLAEQAWEHMSGADQAAWMDLLDQDLANLRLTMEWLATHRDLEPALRLARSLWRFWYVRAHLGPEREWLERILAIEDAESWVALQASTHLAAGALSYRQGAPAVALAHYEQSAAAFRELGDLAALVVSLDHLGVVQVFLGDYAAARTTAEEALDLKRRAGNEKGIPTTLNNLAEVLIHEGDLDTARSLFQQSLEMQRRLGCPVQELVHVLRGLAIVAQFQGEYDVAESCLAEAQQITEDLGDRQGAAIWLLQLGRLANDQGDMESASTYFQRALAVTRDERIMGVEARVLNNLGEIDLRRGYLPVARAYFEKSLAIKQEEGDEFGAVFTTLNLAVVSLREGDLGAARSHVEEGLAGARTLGDLHCAAWGERTLARVAVADGALDEAGSLLASSLATVARMGAKRDIAITLEICAALAGACDEAERALRLLGAAEAIRAAIGAPQTMGEEGDAENIAAAAREPLGEAEADAATEAGRALAIKDAVAFALEGLPEPPAG